MLPHMILCEQWIRPALNKNLFPVYRPGGSKRSDWNFFLIFSKKKISTSRLAVFFPTQSTGNDFLLKGGLMEEVSVNYLLSFSHFSPSPDP